MQEEGGKQKEIQETQRFLANSRIPHKFWKPKLPRRCGAQVVSVSSPPGNTDLVLSKLVPFLATPGICAECNSVAQVPA